MNLRPVMTKQPRYENKRLRDLCHTAPHCFLQVACIPHNPNDGYAPCHSNLLRHGRGSHYKTHDVYVVPGCQGCHDWLDKGGAPREEQEQVFMAGWERWQLYLWQYGLVKVA